MNSRLSQLSTVVAVFATGLFAGLLLAPRSGENTRRRMAVRARFQMRRAEQKLDEVEQQLASLNDRISETGKDITTRVRTIAEETLNDHLPDLGSDADEWNLSEGEVSRELRHLSRK